MMTRKHFIKLADAIKENILYKPNDKDYEPIAVDLRGLIDSIAYVCRCDNNNFDKGRFIAYIEEGIINNSKKLHNYLEE